MVVGGARFALAALLLIAMPVPAQSQPLAAVAAWPADSGKEACHHAGAAGLDLVTGCLNVGPVAGPLVPAYGETIDGDDVPSAMPAGDVRTAEMQLLDLSPSEIETGIAMGNETIWYTRTSRDGDLWCLHLLDGAPLQPAGPAQSLCVRDPLVEEAGPLAPDKGPVVRSNLGTYGQNVALYADRALDPMRVRASVTFTYDCTQMDTRKASFVGDLIQVYSPASLFGGTLADGALGLATTGNELAAVFEVTVEDGAGEVTSTQTTLPGMGHAIAYALFMQQEQAGGRSELCA